ncbi:hypothetical protein ABH899_005452 [Paenibacillus sp. RC84]
MTVHPVISCKRAFAAWRSFNKRTWFKPRKKLNTNPHRPVLIRLENNKGRWERGLAICLCSVFYREWVCGCYPQRRESVGIAAASAFRFCYSFHQRFTSSHQERAPLPNPLPLAARFVQYSFGSVPERNASLRAPVVQSSLASLPLFGSM